MICACSVIVSVTSTAKPQATSCLTWAAVIPFFIASLTVSLSNLPTIKFGYRVRISMNKFKMAISSSFAV